MRIDISFLPAFAAAFMLVFARIGTMVMLLPGVGELSVPVRVRLTIALVLAAVLLPLHRSAYALDLTAFGPVLAMLLQEMFVGAVLGLTARLTISQAWSTEKRGALKMTGPEVLDVARDAIMTLVLVASPLMLIGLLVGVVISLFQALTQIQEMTLVFVPKILAIFIAMLIALPFMADLLQSHMARLAARIMAG